MCIALAAYSCRDSRGLGWRPPAPHSRLSPSRGTGAILNAVRTPFTTLHSRVLATRQCRSAAFPQQPAIFPHRDRREASPICAATKV